MMTWKTSYYVKEVNIVDEKTLELLRQLIREEVGTAIAASEERMTQALQSIESKLLQEIQGTEDRILDHMSRMEDRLSSRIDEVQTQINSHEKHVADHDSQIKTLSRLYGELRVQIEQLTTD